MKVTMRVTIAGTRNGEDWPPAGQVVDLPKDEAEHLVAVGMASAVKAPEVKEPAPSAPKPEKATARKPTTRKR